MDSPGNRPFEADATARLMSDDERALFKHKVTSRVRSYDVDRQAIVHNAVYFYWLEAARVEYFRAIGLPIDRQTFISKHRFVVAHQQIDYFFPAQFDDEYHVYTRVSFIRNTSFGFEQIIELADGRMVGKASAVMVHLNPASNRSERIQDSYRQLVREFEGESVQID